MKKETASFDAFFNNVYIPQAKVRKRSWPLDCRLEKSYLSPVFGSKRLGVIKAKDIEKWLRRLRSGGYAATTCNRALALLKTIFNLAEKGGCVDFSPARDVMPLKTPGARECYLSREEGAALFGKLAGEPGSKAKIILLLLLTGARKSEILRARWENVDWSHHYLIVPLSKSGKSRYVILSEAALETLRSVPRTKDSPWVFPGRNKSRPLSDIFDYWKKIRDELGISDVRAHNLRHTFASVIINSGCSLYEAQKLLGHANPHTTMRYAHLDNKNLIIAAEKAAAAFTAELE